MQRLKISTILLLCLFVVGCAAGGMHEAEKSGFLVDYSMLKDGGSNRAALTYRNPSANFKSYNKIMFDRVVVSLDKLEIEAGAKAISRDEAARSDP